MPDTEIESDPLFTLLTDALRAGPRSPQWREAADALAARGDDATQLQAIIAAREHLESGKTYRTVRPGPNFTRQVMANLDAADESRAGRGGTTPLNIAVAAAVAIAVVIGAVLYVVLPDRSAAEIGTPIGTLVFATPVQTLKFDGSPTDNWLQIGSTPIASTAAGLQAATRPAGPSASGLYWNVPLSPDQPAAVEVLIHGVRDPSVAVQLFVTDTTDFSPDRGTSSDELVWQMKGVSTQVFLPGGISTGPADHVKPDNGVLTRLAFSKTSAMLTVGGKLQWTGPLPLSPTKPRYVGVRLISSGSARQSPAIVSLRVLEP